jgi:hypothetical protein
MQARYGSAHERVAGIEPNAFLGHTAMNTDRASRGMLPAISGIARGAGNGLDDPASRPPLSEPRRRVMSCWTGGASGRRASLAQGVPPVLSFRPAHQ